MRMAYVLVLLGLLIGCKGSPTSIPPNQDCANAVPAESFRIKLHKGRPDLQGLKNYRFEFSNQPIQVWAGSEDYIINYSQRIKLRERVRILQICSFIGLLQGDVVEADVKVGTGRVSLYKRSVHKEILDNYDAFDCKDYGDSFFADTITISVVGRTNNVNEITGACFAQIHYGVHMIVVEEGE